MDNRDMFKQLEAANAERRRIMEERAAKGTRIERSVGEEVEVRRSCERMTLRVIETHDEYYKVVQVFAGGCVRFDPFIIGRWDFEISSQRLLQENTGEYYA